MDKIIKQRHNLLNLLYQARMAESEHLKAYLPISDLADAIGECRFNLGVLEELGYIERQGYKVRITGAGVLACEAGGPAR